MLWFALSTWLGLRKWASGCLAMLIGKSGVQGENASPLLSLVMLSGYPCLFSLRNSLGKYNSQGVVMLVILKLFLHVF